MRSITYLVLLSLVACVTSSSYFFGDMSDKLHLVHKADLVLQAIPLKKRIKTFEYKGPTNLVIKAVRCYDHKNGDATVDLIGGGIDYSHVTLRIKSQRGQKLDFEIEVYK